MKSNNRMEIYMLLLVLQLGGAFTGAFPWWMLLLGVGFVLYKIYSVAIAPLGEPTKVSVKQSSTDNL